MKRTFTLLLASLTLWLGSTTVFGQLIIDPTWNNVNNDFGAGESVTILGNNISNSNPAINTPILNGSSGKIKIGGASADNQVVRVYNGNGYGIGWVSVLRMPYANTDPAKTHSASGFFDYPPFYNDIFSPTYNHGNSIDYATSVATIPSVFLGKGHGSFTPAPGTGAKYQNLIVMSFNSFNTNDFTGKWTGSSAAPCGEPLFENSATNIQSDGSSLVKVWHHNPTTMLEYQCNAITRPGLSYTTTMGSQFSHTPGGHGPMNFNQDDGIKLTQFKGTPMQDAGALANQKTPQSEIGKSSSDDDATTWYIDNYTRPTTIAIAAGNTMLDIITLETINWSYEVNYVDVNEISNYSGLTRNNAECNSGRFRAYAFEATWDPSVHSGATHPDAAVQLINGAIVCVKEDVKDNTGKIANKASGDTDKEETNALIVWPVNDRVSFRTKGDFQANMYHERNLVTTANILYTTVNFPDPDENIYLYDKTLAPSDPFNTPTNLSGFNHTGITQHVIDAPATEAKASIFGVYGDYLHTGNMAWIHTDTAATANKFNAKVPGVIEVGSNTAGKDFYNVYTSGILKNFEGCDAPNNFTMNFGNNFGSGKNYGLMPHFAFTEKEPLFILNYGNNGDDAGCAADIHFYGGAPDSLTKAFANAEDEGALQIQSLSDVEFRATTTIDATVKGNNLYLLSDGGNVVTQKFDILSNWVGNTGEGLITFWAEDREPGTIDFSLCANNNRNGQRGNLFLNDSVRVSRTGTLNGTETNLIAGNNIRTAMFDFKSTGTKNDTTNVISRKGDIYLGYSTDAKVYDDLTAGDVYTGHTYDKNVFTYNIDYVSNEGVLNIKAGYDDPDNTTQYDGGNIYFTHIKANMIEDGNYPTNITIPFSNEYYCGSTWSKGMLHERLNPAYPDAMKHYEHAGIIGGVGRCGTDANWADYGGKLEGARGPGVSATDTSLIYHANNGQLLVDAGTRGNIIMNRGSFLNFQNNNANGFFLTRYGDIDMRYPTNVQNLEGSLLFLASSELNDKLNVTPCGCDEQRNNVYLQDFRFKIDGGNGSIFVGADNNIKLQYGGLRNIGTQRDPFLSENTDYPCGTGKYHCDSDPSVNQAHDLILDFNKASVSGNGGFAAVASDLVDIYKNLIYNGGASGQGMSSVPNYGSLHGENVSGYGLYIKTQANKKNWNKTDHGVNSDPNPLTGSACESDICESDAFLHQTARVTFHADARLYPENQKVFISSPVLETYGIADYNTHYKKDSKTSIMIQADSLIYHDSLIIEGTKTQFSTWSGLYRNMPIIRLGHQRLTPPAAEEECKDCFTHPKDPYSSGNKALDTVFVTFRNDATINRLHTLVAEHAVISFLTDSFDHQKGNPTLNARFFTDTFKIRNHVELFNTPDRTHDGHFELVSETQMGTKDYAGIYSRHLHMEPIAPSCSRFGYSQLWMQDHALDVITTSTYGGFGWLHADVHVENDANLFPGYASLRHDGNCYEQQAGILKMQDLRLDKGANLTFSIGDKASSFAEKYDCDQTFETTELGRYADCLDVDSLTIYGSVDLDMIVRPEGLALEPGEARCFPVIRYKSVEEGILNHLKMNRLQLTSKDHPSIEGTYYLTLDVDTACNIVYICIATIPDPVIRRPVIMPSISGITTHPVSGKYYVTSGSGFKFTAKYGPEYSREGEQIAVRTGRIINGKEEIIVGVKNANGEYEYYIPEIRSDINLTFGPDYVSADNVEGSSVWSYNDMIYIQVDKEEIASVYLVTGQLVRQIEVPEGTTSIPMQRGIYIVTLKDGSVHKVIVK